MSLGHTYTSCSLLIFPLPQNSLSQPMPMIQRSSRIIRTMTRLSQIFKYLLMMSLTRRNIGTLESRRVDVVSRPYSYTPTSIDDTLISRVTEAKYLGVNLDSKLNWRVCILPKKKAVKHTFRWLYCMFSLKNKLLSPEQVTPVCNYPETYLVLRSAFVKFLHNI